MRKYILLLVFLLMIQMPMFSLKFYLANVNVYSDNQNVELNENDKNFTEIIFKAIKSKDIDGFINIGLVKDAMTFSDKITKSTLEASELCELLQVDYLLYGFLKKTNKYYDAEIRLYENSTKTDRKTFYSKVELDSFDGMIADFKDKIVDYLYNMLGKTEFYKERKKGFGGLGIYSAAGYWFPIGEWWRILTGLINIELGINVIPVTPLAKYRNFGFYLRFGLYVSYDLGMNKPDHLQSYFHSLGFYIPIETCFEVYFYNVFIIGTGPQLQLDILYQEKIFDNPSISTTASFSIIAFAGYERWFGKKKIIGIGVNNIFDFTFYNNMYFDYKIQFYTIARIPIIKDN